MLRLRRFLMHHFICVFNGNAYIILINSDFQKQRQVKISVKRRLIGVILTQCVLKTMLIRTVRTSKWKHDQECIKVGSQRNYLLIFPKISTSFLWHEPGQPAYDQKVGLSILSTLI